LNIEHVDPKTIAPADYNPRQMSARQRRALERSLTEYGFVQPIVVNKRTNTIVGGHQRLTAALGLGYTEVPVLWVELDDKREKALNVALNKISGDWDYPALIELLQSIEEESEFEHTGFDYDEFQALEREWLEDSKAGREGLVPPPPRIARSREGEVYKLGDHILVSGDSTDPESYRHSDEPCRMMFTDPPYNVAYQADLTPEQASVLRRRSDGVNSIANDSFEDSDAFRDFLVAFLLAALIKNKGATYLCYSSSESEAVHGAWRLADLHGSSDIHHVNAEPKTKAARKGKRSKQAPDVILWDKDGFSLARSHYQPGHEPILYGWHKGATNKFWCGDRDQRNVWVYPKPSRSPLHPTMKPVELVERAIRNSSEAGDWVLDPFAGSGSTLVAAENIGRRCYTIELDPRFVDVIVRRYQSLGGTGEVELIVKAEDSEDGWWNEPDADEQGDDTAAAADNTTTPEITETDGEAA
jgi:DNA modification methylase